MQKAILADYVSGRQWNKITVRLRSIPLRFCLGMVLLRLGLGWGLGLGIILLMLGLGLRLGLGIVPLRLGLGHGRDGYV